MPLPANFKELLHNKPALAGIGVAGVVGVIVFVKHRGSTSSSNTAAAAQTTGAGGVATFDSRGTDLGSFLGDYSTRLDTQLGGYIQQLKDLQDGTGGTSQIPPGDGGTGHNGGGGHTYPTSFTVHAGDNVNADILRAQTDTGGNPNAIWDWLYANTSIKNNTNFTPGGDSSKNTFKADATYQLSP